MELIAVSIPPLGESYPCEVYEKVVALQRMEPDVEYDVVYTIVACLN
jgi:hypothetical protein